MVGRNREYEIFVGGKGMKLAVKKLSTTAKLPERAHKQDAGLDVYSDESITLEKGKMYTIVTGVAISIPNGFYGRLKARSGLTLKTPLNVKEGTIDSGYHGEIKVIANLKETGVDTYKIEKGDKIAQLIVQQVPEFEIEEVTNLGESDRGEKGFGSTGFRQADIDVVVYMKPKADGFCAQCMTLKNTLKAKGVPFIEIEAKSQKERELLKEWGFMQFPVTHIKSTDVKIGGFDIVALRENVKGMK